MGIIFILETKIEILSATLSCTTTMTALTGSEIVLLQQDGSFMLRNVLYVMLADSIVWGAYSAVGEGHINGLNPSHWTGINVTVFGFSIYCLRFVNASYWDSIHWSILLARPSIPCVHSNRELKTRAWLALLLTAIVLFLISTFIVLQGYSNFVVQVKSIMFSTNTSLDARVASILPLYILDDTNDCLVTINVFPISFWWMYTLWPKLQFLISDWIVIWRTWVLSRTDSWAKYMPILFWIGSFGRPLELWNESFNFIHSSLVGLFIAERIYTLGHGGESRLEAAGQFADQTLTLNETCYALSLVCNLLCTVLIGYRAW